MDTFKIRFERSIEVLQAPTMLAALNKSCAAKYEPFVSIEQTTMDGKVVHKIVLGEHTELKTWQSIAV